MTAHLRAALWMIGSILSFSSMAVAGRELGGAHDTFEVMFYRSCIGVLIIASVIIATGRFDVLRLTYARQHIVRNIAHFTGQNLWFLALTMIPLAQLFALEFTSPLWVVLLAPLFLKERITPKRAMAVLLGFIGILIVAQPFSGHFDIGLLIAAGSAIFFALTAIFTRQLTRHEPTLAILAWLTVTQLFFGAVCALYDGTMTLPTAATLPWLVLIGCAGVLAHTCLTQALSLAPATLVIPIDFLRLPLIAIIGALFYDEPLGWALFIGAIVIVIGNLINLRETTPRRSES